MKHSSKNRERCPRCDLMREVVFVRDTATEKEWMILRLGEQSFILSDSNRLR